MSDKAFNRRLVHSVVLTIMAYKIFVSLLKTFIADVLKRYVLLKTNFKCLCIARCSLVMSPFSRDFKRQKCTN